MKYITATPQDAKQVACLVQETIKAIYPRYYPQEIVNFFCELHCEKNVLSDIEMGTVGILLVDGKIVGTGCYRANHIIRVYVNPTYQGRGYGSYIMNYLEKVISANYKSIELDASLPASHFYEKRGYVTREHKKWVLEKNVTLVYEIMEK